jgi:hypothetical protein
MKPPKESTTPSGPRGLHPTGALARTHRKINLPPLKNIAHPHESGRAPKGVNHFFEASEATPDGCPRVHPLENKPSTPQEHSTPTRKVAEPPCKYQSTSLEGSGLLSGVIIRGTRVIPLKHAKERLITQV